MNTAKTFGDEMFLRIERRDLDIEDLVRKTLIPEEQLMLFLNNHGLNDMVPWHLKQLRDALNWAVDDMVDLLQVKMD
jgi:hypothetical protein